ncbi:hypothetical protein B9Z65_202 [Elsinoe australis]|uniref:Uncharacterized protein n=1 Tax=Elsinoe australis TaxID=40998 RepID=A0A2P7Z7N0_9PEZI|nr:hypothetical protein B9Z65_202 [Elsinoe australis]
MKRDTSNSKRASGGSPISQHCDASRSPSPRSSPSPISPTHSKPVSIPSSRNTSRTRGSRKTSSSSGQTVKSRRESGSTSTRAPHQRDALPPSVAALLAVTAIPPRKSSSSKRRIDPQQRVSIDALVQSWRSEALSMPSYGSHKSMEILMEPSEPVAEGSVESVDTYPDTLMSSRSASTESIPSMELDEHSLLSIGNPPTPDGGRTSRAGSLSASARKSKPRSLTPSEDCALDHPLLPRSTPDMEDEWDFPTPILNPTTNNLDRRKTSFKSNLTLSLQSLKSRALSSLSQLSLNNAGPQLSNTPYAFSDETLWSHPYIFPRLSPEVRPVSYSGLPGKSERRYFNPTVLNFEEEQARYRRALHNSVPEDSFSVTTLEEHRRSPMIQMKTYSRPTPPKRSKAKSGPNPNSEAGRALAGPPLVRQREPRENSDFLRVVVLEMNMRRIGKLEETIGGRARIWLPPRQNVVLVEAKEVPVEGIEVMLGGGPVMVEGKRRGKVVPRRWVSVGVDD